MTDREWRDALPPAAEFLTPPGFRGTPGGLRCRPAEPDIGDPNAPGPDCGLVELWAGGVAWVPLAELRTWPTPFPPCGGPPP